MIFQARLIHRPDGGSTHIWNVDLLRDYTARYPRRLSYSHSPPWKPKPHIPEDSYLHTLRLENLRSHIPDVMFMGYSPPWEPKPHQGLIYMSHAVYTMREPDKQQKKRKDPFMEETERGHFNWLPYYFIFLLKIRTQINLGVLNLNSSHPLQAF
jgi:hypothetical protein